MKEKSLTYQTYEELIDNKCDRAISAVIARTPDHHKNTIKSYYNYLFLKGATKQSIRHCFYIISKFLDQIQKPIEQLTKEDIQDFLISKNNLNQASRVRYFTAVKGLLTSLNKQDCIADIDMKKPLKIKLPEEILTIDEIKRMIEATTNYRDRALLFTLYETAARAGEILSLRIKHVTFDEDGAKILFPKSKTDPRILRVVRCVSDLKKWIDYHPCKNNPSEPLWINIHSHKKTAIGNSGIKNLVKAVANRAGIKKNVYPHLFRHSRLTELAKNGLNEVQLRIIAGWGRSSTMAEVYIHLSGADVEEKILELEGIRKETHQSEINLLKSHKCWRCNEENGAVARFCSRCGADLDEKKRHEDRTILVKKSKDVDMTKADEMIALGKQLIEMGKLSKN